jgi:hypothetical protein
MLRKLWLLIIAHFKPLPVKVLSNVKQNAADTEEYGQFYFRHTILDQLDRYFIILKRMKKGDSQAYNLYSQIGAYILPERIDAGFESFHLEPLWLDTRPAFGMVLYGSRTEHVEMDKEKNVFVPFAVYYTKYAAAKAPVAVQPVHSGDIYVCTVYWDSFKSLKRGSPTEFAVNISLDGEVRVLKIRENKTVKIRAKKGKDKGSVFTFSRQEWGVPSFFKDWAKSHKVNVHLFLTTIFIEAANAQMAAAESMIKVKVFKDRMAAIFSVNVLRTPYFFRDRDLYVGPTGKKKKIFHIVRAHVRKSGSPVRTHFRGMREFLWKGYKIEITVPGWHHFRTHEFNVGSTDEEHIDDMDNPKWLDTTSVGKIINNWEKDKVGSLKR